VKDVSRASPVQGYTGRWERKAGADAGAAYDFLIGDDIDTLLSEDASFRDRLVAGAFLGTTIIPQGRIAKLGAVVRASRIGARVAETAAKCGKAARVALKGLRRGIGKGPAKKSFNPFLGKTPTQVDEMFTKKGFEMKGPNPIAGKGSYINPNTSRSYYIDKGGTYRKGYEPPHVDVSRSEYSPFKKRKFPLE
jgi:hypothetical protein